MVFFLVALVMASLASWLFGKLTSAGAIWGAFIAFFLLAGCEPPGVMLLAGFFVSGIFASGWRKERKTQLVTQPEQGPRTAGQVLANGGIAGICGLLALNFPEEIDLFTLLAA
ncbi:MAG: DUF92 domain-containing protein, partial [Chitinophagaceae bacterium]